MILFSIIRFYFKSKEGGGARQLFSLAWNDASYRPAFALNIKQSISVSNPDPVGFGSVSGNVDLDPGTKTKLW